MQVTDELTALGGVATWRSLRERGVSWRALNRSSTNGEVRRLRRGVYALPGATGSLVSAVRLGGVLAGPTAAQHHGWRLLEPQVPYVAVPRTWSHARLAGVRTLRVDLQPAEVRGIATSEIRTLLDCGRRLSLREAVVIADSALQAGVDAREFAAAAARARGPGSSAVRTVARLAEGRAESVIETCIRLILVDLGVTFTLQQRIRDVGRVDLVVDGWLVIEADGFAFHSDREAYRNDRRRATALARDGWTLLRFTYEDAVHAPERVAAIVSDVIAVGPRRADRQPA